MCVGFIASGSALFVFGFSSAFCCGHLFSFLHCCDIAFSSTDFSWAFQNQNIGVFAFEL
jgi:hypothetical protein